MAGGYGVTRKFRVSIRRGKWKAWVSLCRNRDQAEEFGGVCRDRRLHLQVVQGVNSVVWGEGLVGVTDAICGPEGGHLSISLPLSYRKILPC